MLVMVPVNSIAEPGDGVALGEGDGVPVGDGEADGVGAEPKALICRAATVPSGLSAPSTETVSPTLMSESGMLEAPRLISVAEETSTAIPETFNDDAPTDVTDPVNSASELAVARVPATLTSSRIV